MLKLMIPEIFEAVAAAPTEKDKIEILRHNDHLALRAILKAAFDPKFIWDLPAGTPPCKLERDLPKGFSGSNLYSQARLLYIWDKANTKVNRTRKETLFINFLEGLHWTEADFMCLLKDKKLGEVYHVTPALVKKAFPNYLKEASAMDTHQ